MHGHRGARGARPENTLIGFEYAADCGAQYIELDILATKDNQLVVCHDPILNPDICVAPSGARLTDKVIVRSLHYDELAQFDCGSLGNPRFPKQKAVQGLRIPLLREVFEQACTSSKLGEVAFNIECKSLPAYPELFPTPEQFAKLLYELLKEFCFQDRAIIQSFDHRVLGEIRKIDEKLSISALFGDNYFNYSEVAKSVQAQFVSINLHWIDKPMLEALHKDRIKVLAWIANTKEDWKRLIDIGVDGIITDYPEELIEFL